MTSVDEMSKLQSAAARARTSRDRVGDGRGLAGAAAFQRRQ